MVGDSHIVSTQLWYRLVKSVESGVVFVLLGVAVFNVLMTSSSSFAILFDNLLLLLYNISVSGSIIDQGEIHDIVSLLCLV